MISTHAAVDFIIGKIVDEAARRGLPLSDIERQVLSFSESPRTSRKMVEAMETFEREYDEAGYERKVVKFLRGAYNRTRSTEKDAWAAAIRRLKNVDVYLGVMMDRAGLFRAPGDRLRLIATAGAMWVVFIGLELLLFTLLGREFTRDESVFYLWISALALACVYAVARWLFGDSVDRWTDWVFDVILWRKRDRTER